MRMRATPIAIVTALSLAACGGETGGGTASLPGPLPASPSSSPSESPSPTPSASPSPTPSASPSPTPSTSPIAIFQPPPGGSVAYTSVGYVHNGTTNPIEDAKLSIVYDAPSSSYIGTWNPPNPSFRLDSAPQGDNSRFIGLASGGAVYRTGSTNPEITLTYSSLLAQPLGSPWDYGGGAFVAFGTATPVGSVPITGSATYNGVAYGQSLSTDFGVRGSVLLNFNFGAGSLTGYFDPVLTQGGAADLALARQTLANTVFGQGSQIFSGSFAGITGSSFNGQFTGPAAEEFIGRFRQPYGTDTLVGAWVGKR